MRGEIEFGVITQSAITFTTLVAAYSLVVTQFQSLSTYAAVASRAHWRRPILHAADRADRERQARETVEAAARDKRALIGDRFRVKA